ncbi:MAG: ribosome-associated translation inhibitor RaiA [Anaerolineae bacterium]|nr:ribosome-associated translation inhibitor RaiA [Anaerolineae bacterium]
MEVQIHAKNMEIQPPLRDYIQKKTERLDRYLPNIIEARLDLRTQRQKQGGDRAIMQLTVRDQRGTILRVEDKSQNDLKAAVDVVLDKMYRRIRTYKGKQRRKGGERFAELEPEMAAAEMVPGEAEYAAQEEDESKLEVVRRKVIPVRPMTEDEAVEQMELLGHDFFMFLNSTTNTICVAYLREEGNYGILEPDVA